MTGHASDAEGLAALGLVALGTVARSHGLRGLVRVRCHDPESTTLGEIGEARGEVQLLGPGPAPRRPVRVTAAIRDAMGYLVQFEGVDGRDVADLLRGARILVPRAELPPPEDDEVYVRDLVGCTVRDLAGNVLGVVRDVEYTGRQELLVLELPVAPSPPGAASPRVAAVATALAPFIAPLVVAVDLVAREITYDPPEGLFEVQAEARPKADR